MFSKIVFSSKRIDKKGEIVLSPGLLNQNVKNRDMKKLNNKILEIVLFAIEAIKKEIIKDNIT